MFVIATTGIAKRKLTDFVAIDPVVPCDVIEACSAGALVREACNIAGTELIADDGLYCKPAMTTLWEG